MTTSKSFVQLLSIVLCLTCRSVSPCEYPDYLQSDASSGSKRADWRSHIVEGGIHENKLELSLRFDGEYMICSVLGGIKDPDGPKPYRRECRIEIRPGRYLTSHQEVGENGGLVEKYLCMEFIQRSEQVVQVRKSYLSHEQNPMLCTDQAMELDPWPLINRAEFYAARTTCSLEGGFSTTWRDMEIGKDICVAYQSETRIESECQHGDGLYFRFRHASCVPDDLHMKINQRLYCMANWQEGEYDFSVIRSDSTAYAWCMRIPKVRNKFGFSVYLFRDVICDSADTPASTERYFRIYLAQDPSYGMDSLCVDDYEACSFWKGTCLHAGSFMQLTCAKQCRVCTDTRPAICTIPDGLHGVWSEQLADGGNNNIEVNREQIVVQGLPLMRCIQWSRRSHDSDVQNLEQMMVTTFENGCKPRYTCAYLKKHSPSVMKYKLSQGQIWPFEDTTGVSVGCDSFRYHEDDYPYGSRYHSRHHKVTIRENGPLVGVACQLPQNPMVISATYFHGLDECKGRLVQNDTELILELPNCQDAPVKQVYRCLDSSHHGYLSQRIIISTPKMKQAKNNVTIYCWIFPPGQPHEIFYLVPLEECNAGAYEHISSGHLLPLATFTHYMPSTTARVLPDETVLIYNESQEDGNVVWSGGSQRRLPQTFTPVVGNVEMEQLSDSSTQFQLTAILLLLTAGVMIN